MQLCIWKIFLKIQKIICKSNYLNKLKNFILYQQKKNCIYLTIFLIFTQKVLNLSGNPVIKKKTHQSIPDLRMTYLLICVLICVRFVSSGRFDLHILTSFIKSDFTRTPPGGETERWQRELNGVGSIQSPLYSGQTRWYKLLR